MYYAKLIYHYLYQWQTLLAGLLALLGALITVLVIRAQIRQADKLANAAVERERVAARAVLALNLADLSQYAAACIRLFAPYADGVTRFPSTATIPTLPEESIVALQNCVRFSAPEVSEQISVLLNKLQVQNARIKSFVPKHRAKSLLKFECTYQILDAADIYAEIDRLFIFSRDEESMRKRRPKTELSNAVRVNGIIEDDHPVTKAIEKLEK